MTSWPPSVDEILGGDQAIALAHVTPAGGVVVTPVTNFALGDPDRGTVAVNSSVGMWRKLERMRDNPHVALAFHTRAHGFSERPEYVLVQGTASIPPLSDDDAWQTELGANWERFGGKSRDVGPLWKWWMRVYHRRVTVEIAVERLVVWPGLDAGGAPVVHGAALPGVAPPQAAPAKGTGRRIDHRRAASRVDALPDALLGWTGSDGFPVVVPVTVAGTDERGILLGMPGGLVPPGGRRAGLTAHWFAKHVVGQRQRIYTGWLEAGAEGGPALYAPHTEKGYRLPASRFVFNFAAGFGTRRGLRAGRRAGIAGL